MQFHRTRFRLLVVSTALFSSSVIVGCGRTGLERASIHGTVTLDGQPVESGSVRLVSISEKGGPSSGGEIVSGEYYIDDAKGPALGLHRVEVYVPYNTGRKIPSPMGGPVTIEIDPNAPPDPTSNQNQSGMVDAWSDKAPLKYNRESILKVEIQSGSNEFNIEMDSK